jgi:hypothetical protein
MAEKTANAATPRPAVDLSVRAVEVLLSEHGREYRRSTNRRSSLSLVLALSPVFAVLLLRVVCRIVQDHAAS